MEGWISLHRKIQNSSLWNKKRRFSEFEAWVSLLFKANYKDIKTLIDKSILEIKAGSFITSEVKLSEEWNWSRNTVRRFLELLENEKMIKKTATTKWTSVTIVNWGLYQNREQQNEQQVNNTFSENETAECTADYTTLYADNSGTQQNYEQQNEQQNKQQKNNELHTDNKYNNIYLFLLNKGREKIGDPIMVSFSKIRKTIQELQQTKEWKQLSEKQQMELMTELQKVN